MTNACGFSQAQIYDFLQGVIDHPTIINRVKKHWKVCGKQRSSFKGLGSDRDEVLDQTDIIVLCNLPDGEDYLASSPRQHISQDVMFRWQTTFQLVIQVLGETSHSRWVEILVALRFARFLLSKMGPAPKGSEKNFFHPLIAGPFNDGAWREPSVAQCTRRLQKDQSQPRAEFLFGASLTGYEADR